MSIVLLLMSRGRVDRGPGGIEELLEGQPVLPLHVPLFENQICVQKFYSKELIPQTLRSQL